MPVRAHATLIAGCDFISRHKVTPAVRNPWADKVHNRMVANRLRELDRFLSVLLEEVAAALGGLSHDAKRFARTGSTARKLRMVEGMAGKPSGHDARLRAIGRVAARLRRGDGQMVTASHSSDVLLAGGGRQPGEQQVLQSISEFYRHLGNQWIKEVPLRQ